MSWTVDRGAGIWKEKKGRVSLSPPRIELQQDRASGGRALARSLVDDDGGGWRARICNRNDGVLTSVIRNSRKYLSKQSPRRVSTAGAAAAAAALLRQTAA